MVKIDDPKKSVAFKKGDWVLLVIDDVVMTPREWKYDMTLYEVEDYAEMLLDSFERIVVTSVNNHWARTFLWETGRGWSMV